MSLSMLTFDSPRRTIGDRGPIPLNAPRRGRLGGDRKKTEIHARQLTKVQIVSFPSRTQRAYICGPFLGDHKENVAMRHNDSSALRSEVGGETGEEHARSEKDAALQLTIERLVIPRLVMAHSAETYGEAECPSSRPFPTEEEVVELAVIAISDDYTAALALVESIARAGVSTEALLLDLIAPAARMLGEEWKEDRRSFTEVTLGLGTLHRLVGVISPSYAPVSEHRGLVLLITAPGDQHTLGLYITGDFLRKAGWGVQIEPRMAESELCGFLRVQHTEMLGISVSNEASLVPLKPMISRAKLASKNQSMALMVGGALDLTAYASGVGAICCKDPRNAVAILDLHASGRPHQDSG